LYYEPLKIILAQKPDLVLMGGPPIYLSFKLEPEDLAAAQQNLTTLARSVPKLVVDHHLLRSLDYLQYLQPVIQAGNQAGNKVLTAAEFIGREPMLLEARRRELHEKEPIEREWYERLEKGEFKSGF